MKNTNKNMLYTFWSGAILLCLALVAVVLVFTNAVGNTHASKPQNDPAAAVNTHNNITGPNISHHHPAFRSSYLCC